MGDEFTADARDRRRSLYAYLEPLWAGRRVLEIGQGPGSTDLLQSMGAAQVIHADADVSGVTDRFEAVVVPEADALVRRPGAVASWRRLLSPGGRLVVAVGNADRPGAKAGVGYYDLHGAIAPHLPAVQMLGMTPFAGIGVVEFDGTVDALRIDSRLVKEPEPPAAYVAIGGAEPLPGLGYALVQLPHSERTPPANPVAPVAPSVKAPDAEAVTQVARARGEEIEELRARLRRAAEDRTALDGENAKLRKALAEANESVVTVTRRTAEEMTAVADRLAVGLRAPLEAELRAAAAALGEARDEASRLRVKLAESDARASAAEQRLEEVGGVARERQRELEDAIERYKLADSELGRARRELSRLETEAKLQVAGASAVDGLTQALGQRDERILRLEGEKQDLVWRLAELEDKLRQAIARAVQGGARTETVAPPPAPVVALDDTASREARERAQEDFHRASAAHVDEITDLKASVAEQTALISELEDTLAAAESRAATAGAEAQTLRRTAKDLEEADRSRRARLAELEGKLLRFEHERKQVVQRDDADEGRLRALETERDRLRVRVGELEAASVRAPAPRNGHDESGVIARDLESAASRLENTLDNYRRRASRLQDDLQGIRRRLESLSPSEVAGFLEELGEDLAELGA
ncbi:MAG TPA: hypothetical protein VHG72_05050 [Polyangia bacterium]|nr:hypothetical protein [Polyangia bacterium]